MHELRLRAGRHPRIESGHPWVYASEAAERLPTALDGDCVFLRDARGRPLGAGVYNGRSQIVWRRYTKEHVPLDRAFLHQAILAAIARRPADVLRRLVWSDADALPGLVVDQYQKCLVVQTLTLAMENRRKIIASILETLLQPEEIVFRNDAPSRRHEGLEPYIENRSGAVLAPFWVQDGPLRFLVDLGHGHKTGLYLDQRPEHRAVAQDARGRRVLDCFCNQGGFALWAAQAGAGQVIAIDSSEDALAAGRANAEANGLSIEFRSDNVFDALSGALKGESFDLVILDPPSFAPKKAALDKALRGYKELNLRAMKMLPVGGLLATYSCSQACDRGLFMEVLAAAAADAGGDWQVKRLTGQGPDHPVRLGVPETEYLKGAVLLRIG